MCGIVGIYAYRDIAPEVDHQELRFIRDHMAQRGPDGEGEWYSDNNRIALGHRRLSIIDLSVRAAQPMTSAGGQLVVSFNGEIFNYVALRKELEEKGVSFRTTSDTEVLLHLYADRGEAMVHDLRGMFAFAIWDDEKGALLLARDPYGIKPLYYADDGKTLRFASQVKALLAGGGVSNKRDPAGWVGYYLFGSVPEPFTTYQGISALPAGATMWINAEGPQEKKTYFSIADVYCRAEAAPASIDEENSQRSIREALKDSVRHHLVADVPVGVFLSAGIDSGAIVGLMHDLGQKSIQTITLSFEEFSGQNSDESPLATEVARLYGTKHTVRVVSEKEFHEDLPKILEAMDQPTIDGINSWFVSKAASELGLKVVLSGLGGDELLGGYPSFADIPRWVHWFAGLGRIPFLGRGLRKLILASKLADFAQLSPKVAGLVELGGTYSGAYLLRRGTIMPWELEQVLDKQTIREGLERLKLFELIDASLMPRPKNAFSKVSTLESSLYMRNQLLRDIDWASMAHSIEVRVPLVDTTLLEALARFTTGPSDRAFKEALARSPTVALPKKIILRQKTGFSTPIALWLQHSLQNKAHTSVPALASNKCHWSRRWAYNVAISQMRGG